jgi:hypothetical protein
VTPAENSKGKVKTWVNSQWKFRLKVGQFSMALNSPMETVFLHGTVHEAGNDLRAAVRSDPEVLVL